MLDKRTLRLIINKDVSLIKAMKQMDLIDKKSLLVFDNKKFINILSIGDIQRAILKNYDLKSPISKIIRKETKLACEDMKISEIKILMKEFRMEILPSIDSNGNLVHVYFWEDLFKSQKRQKKIKFDIPVIIMAGGQGTRMRPLTNIIPKPLIPIGNSSIIEEIISRFQDVGCNNFFSSVNYKSEIIEFYFNQIKDKSYNINFFKEEKPLGTAGSLHLLKGQINSTFFVSNCDILIDDEYEEMYNYHKKNKNELTIISAIKDYSIPYGTLVTKNDGVLTDITEKPDFNFQINTGFYIVEPHLIDEIPKNIFYHITHLIEKLLKENRKVGVFPVSSGSWTDIGVWSEYLRHIEIKN